MKKKLDEFIKVRAGFERFILKFDYLAQQINRKHRTAQRSYPFISAYFANVVIGLTNNESDECILSRLSSMEDFSYITTQQQEPRKGKAGERFTRDDKSAIFLRDVLQGAPKCKICQGYIHRNSISIDHATRRADGGTSGIDNGQLTHPYCNTGYKS